MYILSNILKKKIYQVLPHKGLGLGWVDIFDRSIERPFQNLGQIGLSASCIPGFGTVFRRIYIFQPQPQDPKPNPESMIYFNPNPKSEISKYRYGIQDAT